MIDPNDNLHAVAIEEAIRGKTVAIVGGSGQHKWRGLGTGTLIGWRGTPLVLTAAHVIDGTNTADLRFFPPFPTPPRKAERPELLALTGAPDSPLQPFIELPILAIHRDDAHDLAAIVLAPDVQVPRPAEFFEMGPGGRSPSTGTTIIMTGFPHDLTRQLQDGNYVAFIHAEWTDVCEPPDTLAVGFDAGVHFVAPYEQRLQYAEAQPQGLSGSAAWYRVGPTPALWHANIDIGGLTVSWFTKPNLLKAVRREVIDGFLARVIGT